MTFGGLKKSSCSIHWQNTANSSQGSGVKRADGCTTGAGGPSAKQTVRRPTQVSVADFLAGAAHSLELHHPPLADHCVPWNILPGTQSPPQRLRPRHSCVPLGRSSHRRGLCRETLPGSSRLGNGAAPGPWGTDPQAEEHESPSHHAIRLRGVRPVTPSPFVLEK